MITSGQVLYKLDALKEIGKFSSSFQCLSDLDAICRISRAGRVLFDPARNVNCEITDSLRKKRRRFLEYEKLLFDRLYIDRMLSDRKCFNSYYRNLVSAAVRAGYPVEVLQYSVIAFIRFPVANTKLLFLGTVRAIGSMICGMKNKCLLKGYSGDIRKTALGMRAKAKAHKYGILRVGRDKRAAFTAKEAGEIPDFRYAGGELDGTFHVPAGTLRIGEGAFAGCRRLRRIVLPDTVSYIGARAFMDCEQLESVTCSSGSRLVRIDKYAFAGCTSLAEVTLPGDLSHMGRGAFIGCAGLGSLTFLPSLNGNRTEADFADRVPILEPECFAGLLQPAYGPLRQGEYAFPDREVRIL